MLLFSKFQLEKKIKHFRTIFVHWFQFIFPIYSLLSFLLQNERSLTIFFLSLLMKKWKKIIFNLFRRKYSGYAINWWVFNCRIIYLKLYILTYKIDEKKALAANTFLGEDDEFHRKPPSFGNERIQHDSLIWCSMITAKIYPNGGSCWDSDWSGKYLKKNRSWKGLKF